VSGNKPALPLSLLVLEKRNAKHARQRPSHRPRWLREVVRRQVAAERGGSVSHALQVSDLFKRHRELKPEGIAELNEAGHQLAQALARRSGGPGGSNGRRGEKCLTCRSRKWAHFLLGRRIAEGTISRLATRRVLETLQPERTVTICLPLFLAGGEGERAFARPLPNDCRLTGARSGAPLAGPRCIARGPPPALLSLSWRLARARGIGDGAADARTRDAKVASRQQPSRQATWSIACLAPGA